LSLNKKIKKYIKIIKTAKIAKYKNIKIREEWHCSRELELWSQSDMELIMCQIVN